MRSSLAQTKKLLVNKGFDIKLLRFQRRNNFLRNLEGVYQFDYFDDTNLSLYHNLERDIFERCKISLWKNEKPSKYVTQDSQFLSQNKIRIGEKLSRVLINNFKYDKNLVARFMERFKKGEFVFSCDSKDIVRMSSTKHFTSCMNIDNGGKNIQLMIELNNPNIAICYIKDKAGFYIGRCLVRSLISKFGENVVGLQPIYGNILTHKIIANALKNKVKCFYLSRSNVVNRDFQDLREIDSHHNPIFKHQPWVDVTHQIVNENGIKMNGFMGSFSFRQGRSNRFMYIFKGKEIIT